MAGKNAIQFLRGTSTQRASHSEVSLNGQPIYETDTNRLYVGDGKTAVNNLDPINAGNANHATTADSATNANNADYLGTIPASTYVRDDLSTYSIGYSSTASGSNSIAFGDSADAVGNYAVALGSSATANNTNAIAIGNSASASGSNSTALGNLASASGENATALGNDALAIGWSAVALGSSALANGSSATALGPGAEAGENATALGNNATALSLGTALGSNATASGLLATAIGGSASASGWFATAIGAGANASGQGAVALGSSAKAPNDNTIVLGSNAITSLRCQVQTISQLSDSRVKEDVSLANTAQCLVDVNRLPVSRFKYKDFTGTHIDVHRTGFMADDVEKVFPKAVAKFDETFPVLDEEGNKVYEQEVDEKGNPVYEQAVDESGVALFNEDGSIKYDETKPVMKEKTFVMEDVKSIAMEMAIPTLWAAVQELTKRLEVAEAKIAELENK